MSAKTRKGHVSQERWLVSYADFITLLFAFFVVLYAFARADAKKQAQVSRAIDNAFQSMGARPSASAGESGEAGSEGNRAAGAVAMEDVVSPEQVKEDLDRIRRDLAATLSKQVAGHSVSLEMGRDGLVISLREAGFFDSGSATPKAEALSTLRQIAAKLGATPYDVRVEGHTDNLPIHNAQFDSNWELSAARATHIARLFLDMGAIPPERISAAGYAEYHPVASNDTAEGRSENRRVDLVVLPRARLSFAGPGAGQPTAGKP